MVADDQACNGRNVYPGQIYFGDWWKANMNGCGTEIDFRGEEVSSDALLGLLTGQVIPGEPANRRIPTSSTPPPVFLYLNGHGGDGFFKFRDVDELTATDLAEALQRGRQTGLLGDIVTVFDTCQASTLAEPIRTPRVWHVSTSDRGLNSYSYGFHPLLATALSDGFAPAFLERLRRAIDRERKTREAAPWEVDVEDGARTRSSPWSWSDLSRTWVPGRVMSEVLVGGFDEAKGEMVSDVLKRAKTVRWPSLTPDRFFRPHGVAEGENIETKSSTWEEKEGKEEDEMVTARFVETHKTADTVEGAERERRKEEDADGSQNRFSSAPFLLGVVAALVSASAVL